ncbi:hypothetical protein HY029_05825, partial [Candidatus Gottesmanbacteria bacterium]|nr:hypothetical protein [Candidatus Gottesmanbacteria bacterium]
LDREKEGASSASKITGSFDYTLSDLPSGRHKLTLEEIKSNHLSFSPPVKQTVFFTTILPQTPTPTPSPTPFNFLTIVSFINWQQILIFISLSIIVLGVAVKFTFGKPKNWE